MLLKKEDNNINLQILHSIPAELDKRVFELEFSVFSKIYSNCPSSYEEFKKRRSSKNSISVFLFLNSELIGTRIYEVINSYHCHSLLMAIHPSFRKRGYADLICSVSVNYLRWFGYKYISSWTHIRLSAEKFLAKYAPLISESEDLSDIELSLRIEFEKSRNSPKTYKGRKRKVKNFYQMLDSDIGHANFWVHQILG